MSHDKNYWTKRQEQLFLQSEKSIDEYYAGLKKAFEQAQKEIQFVINDFYVQYATENRISYTEAQKRLSKVQVGKLRDYINKVNETMGTYNLELSNMSIKARITRYEALNMQIDAILQYLYTIDYEIKGAKSLMHIYEDNYRQMWYNFDIYTGFHHEFAQIIPSDIEQLIAYPFNGQNFSERLWKQKDYLQLKLKEALTTVLVLGQDPARLSKDFAKAFQAREYEAYRLLHTETSFVMEQSTLASYKKSGVEQYQILATLDNKTSQICRDQDGKIYKVEDATVGTNYPPFHMFCRTTTVPDYEEKPEGVRMARDQEGKAIEVPADMTYREWEKKYIDMSNTKTSRLKDSEGIYYTYNNGQKDIIKPHNIRKNMEKSDIGKEMKEYLENNNVPIQLLYGVDNPYNEYGYYDQNDDVIGIFADETKTVEKTAEVIIHEATHRKYGIGGDKWSEAVCIAQEVKHRKRSNTLTSQEKRDILKLVNKLYPNFRWRK